MPYYICPSWKEARAAAVGSSGMWKMQPHWLHPLLADGQTTDGFDFFLSYNILSLE